MIADPMSGRVRRTLMVIDLVESVRLLYQDEQDALSRWTALVTHLRAELLPAHGGHWGQSLGDGLLLWFDDADQALGASHAIHALAHTLSLTCGADRGFWLRIGISSAVVSLMAGVPMGLAVLRCAAVAAQAEPGATLLDVATYEALDICLRADLRPHESSGLEAGESGSLLRGPPRVVAPGRPLLPTDDIRPRVACVLQPTGSELPEAWCAAMVDDLARAMARCGHWRVCSSASSLQLAGIVLHHDQVSKLGEILGVDWLVVTECRRALRSDHVALRLTLRHCHTGRTGYELDGLIDPENWPQSRDELALGFAREALRSLTGTSHAFDAPVALAQLDAYSLLLRAIQQIHRCLPAAMKQSWDMLAHLRQRHPRASEVAAWRAFWHVLDLTGLRIGNADGLDQAKRSLDDALRLDAHHPLVLAVHGHWQLKLGQDLDEAQQALELSLKIHPNEPLAWAFRAHLHVHDDEPDAARRAIDMALNLAPLESSRYFYDCFASAVLSDAGEHGRGLAHARRAHLLAPGNLSTLAQLILSEVWAGHMDSAREHAKQYLARRPQARVKRLLDRLPGRGRRYVERQVSAYLEAGLPP